MVLRSAAGLDYLDALSARGRSGFTTAEALKVHGGHPAAARAVLRRLRNSGRIASPQREFHVIVPPEFRHLRCLPADYFIDALMRHNKAPYYVGLLSAAALHGAAHQRVQVFQVMVERARRSIRCGKVRIQFVVRGNAGDMPIAIRHTPTGQIRVATPEVTAFDLAGYVQRSGGLNHVATVLQELTEQLRGKRLAGIASLSPVAWSQRLGFMLTALDHGKLAAPLLAYTRRHRLAAVPLAPKVRLARAPLDPDWHVLVNDKLDPDL